MTEAQIGGLLQTMPDTGTISVAPTSDAQIGSERAVSAINEALGVGIRPGLGIDVEVAIANGRFTQMRALHAIQRMRAVNAVYGTSREPERIGVHGAPDFATLQGARVNGLEARGLVRWDPDPSDRRKHRVVLSDTGTELLANTLGLGSAS